MFERCTRCRRPLVNEYNLRVLRRWFFGTLAAFSVTGGVVGAFVLSWIGFSTAGVTAGSWAAAWQGPQVMAGSMFAFFQSIGATGMGSLLFGGIGSVGASGTALFLLRQHANTLNWCECPEM